MADRACASTSGRDESDDEKLDEGDFLAAALRCGRCVI
jgi:hypothetical protein